MPFRSRIFHAITHLPSSQARQGEATEADSGMSRFVAEETDSGKVELKALDAKLHGWDVDPDEIQICTRDDGSEWVLGAGTFGAVSDRMLRGASACRLCLHAAQEAVFRHKGLAQLSWQTRWLASLSARKRLTACGFANAGVQGAARRRAGRRREKIEGRRHRHRRASPSSRCA